MLWWDVSRKRKLLEKQKKGKKRMNKWVQWKYHKKRSCQCLTLTKKRNNFLINFSIVAMDGSSFANANLMPKN